MFINETQTTYLIFDSAIKLIGNNFLTLLMIFMFLLLLCVVLRIPLEFSGAFLLPFLLILWTYNASFLSIAGIVLIYLGVVIAKNLPIK